MKKTLAPIVLTLAFVLGAGLPAHAYRDLETGEFITKDPAGFVDGPNQYSYVNQNPWTKFDPEGLSGELTIATQADGSRTFGMVTGAHSWLIYKNDNSKIPVATYGTYGNNNGAQKKEGVNFNTELNPKYKATQTRTMHIDDGQEKTMGQFLVEQQKKGPAAWTTGDPCSSFAANGWNKTTGESVDPRNGTTGPFSSTPQNLGENLKKLNGGTDSATITPSAKTTQAQSQEAAQQAVLPQGNGTPNGNGAPAPAPAPLPQQKQAPAKPASTPPPPPPAATPPPKQP